MQSSQYAVIGLGRFGSSLALELVRQGFEVLGVDRNEDVVEDMQDQLTHTVVADSTDEDVLRSIGIRNVDCAIVAIGDDIQASILTAILLKDIGVKKVVAKALSVLHGKVLERIGVDRVIFPERDMGIRVAHQLISPVLLDYLEISKDYTIAELSVPACWFGLTLKDLDPRTKYGCSVVAINKEEGMIIAPAGNDVLEKDDIMIVIGTNEQIERLEEVISE